MVRAAAKNFRDVLVVVDPGDYYRLLDAIDKGPWLQFRFDLMRKAIEHTADYDAADRRARSAGSPCATTISSRHAARTHPASRSSRLT